MTRARRDVVALPEMHAACSQLPTLTAFMDNDSKEVRFRVPW
jgi:hypothetical protein